MSNRKPAASPQPPETPAGSPVNAPVTAAPPSAACPPRPLAIGERLRVRSIARLAVSPSGSLLCAHVNFDDRALGRTRARLMLVDAPLRRVRWLTNGPEGDGLPQFTADGRYVLFVSRRAVAGREAAAQKRSVWQIAVDGGEAEIAAATEQDVLGFAASGDGQRIAMLAQRKPRQAPSRATPPALTVFESPQWIASGYPPAHCVVLDRGSRQRFQIVLGPRQHVTDVALSHDGRRLAVAVNRSAHPNDGWSGRVYLADLPEPHTTADAKAVGKTIRVRPRAVTGVVGAGDLCFSADGTRLAFAALGEKPDWLTGGCIGLLDWPPTASSDQSAGPGKAGSPDKRAETGVAIRWLAQSLGEKLDLAGFTPDGTQIYVLGPQPFSRSLGRINLQTGKASWLTAAPAVYRCPAVAAASGDVAFVHETARQAPSICIRSPASKEPVRICTVDSFAQQLGAWPVEMQQASAHDGHASEALVCIPDRPALTAARPARTGSAARPKAPHKAPPPLIVVLHGGPMSSFIANFGQGLDAGSLFALRESIDAGAACCWVNPRGSTGYGPDHRSALAGGLGVADADDVLAHVAQLVQRKKVQACKVLLAGWSYGGYLALATAARLAARGPAHFGLPAGFRFVGGMIGAAPLDFTSLYASCDVHATLPRWFGGKLSSAQASWPQETTLDFLRRAALPLQVFHGNADTRVPVEQSHLLHRLQRELRLPCELHILPRTGHVPADPKLLIEMHRRQAAFLKRRLGIHLHEARPARTKRH